MTEPVYSPDAATLKRDFLASDAHIAVVLCRTDQGNLHSGFIYRVNDSAAFLHLGWDRQLSDRWYWHGLWFTPRYNRRELRALALRCDAVQRTQGRGQQLRYSLLSQGIHFDRSGHLVMGAGANGLTCATFVLAMVRSIQRELVDESSWNVRQDQDLKFLLWLTHSNTCRGHVKNLYLETLPGIVRVQPQEVLGACWGMSPGMPASFSDARRRGVDCMRNLLQQLL